VKAFACRDWPRDDNRAPPLGWKPRWAGAAVRILLLSTIILTLDPGGIRALAEDSPGFTANSADYPWSAIGRLNRSSGGFCTGVLIGRRIVLTAAHCLYNKRTARWLPADAIHFLPGYSKGEIKTRSVARDYQIAPGYDPTKPARIGTERSDWALVLLEKPVGDTAGYLGWAMLNRPGMALAEAGYRQNRPYLLSVRSSCEVLGSAGISGLFFHNCDSIKGESGAPLLVFADNEFYVVGVHIARLTSKGSGTIGAAVAVLAFNRPLTRPVFRFGHITSPEDWGRPEARIPGSRREPVATAQQLLTRLGYRPGPADGNMRIETRDATRDFQRSRGLPRDGVVSVALVGELLNALE
jgi:protease YdgD